MNRKLLLVASLGLLLGGFFAAASVYRSRAAEQAQTLARAESQSLAPEHSPRLGDPSARVVIVEFFDPACEACASFAPIAKGLVDQNPGKVQLVLRYAPLHAGSDLMVAILEGARRQDRYWEALEIMFATQPEWASHQNPRPERIWSLLETGGIDLIRLRADMGDPAIAAALSADIEQGKKLGVRQTPSFFVNDKPLTNFGAAQLKALVQSEIAAVY